MKSDNNEKTTIMKNGNNEKTTIMKKTIMKTRQ